MARQSDLKRTEKYEHAGIAIIKKIKISKMTGRRKVQKVTFGSPKYENDQQMREFKGRVLRASEEQPTVILKSRREYETKGRRFEDGDLWKFLGVSNEKRKKISVGSGA